MGSFKELSFNFNFLHKNKKSQIDDANNAATLQKNINSKSGMLLSVPIPNEKELRHNGQFTSAAQQQQQQLSSDPQIPPDLFISYNMNRKTNSVVSITNTSDSTTTSGSIRDFNNYANRNGARDRNGQEQQITKKPSFNSSSSAMSTSATSSPLSEVSRRMRASNQFDSHSKSSSASRTTNNGVSNSDSDSDSDWDDDDQDSANKKININIKPLSQVTPSKLSASVDELRATVEAWKPLGNLNLAKQATRRHHKSTNLPLHLSQYNLNTNGVNNTATLYNTNNLRRSSIGLRDNEHSSILKPSQTQQTQSPVVMNDRYADLNELFSNVSTLKKEPIQAESNLMLDIMPSRSIPAHPLGVTKHGNNEQSSHQRDHDPFGFNHPTINSRLSYSHINDSLYKEKTVVKPVNNPVIIAVATQESINATFRGNEEDCVVQLLGYVKIAVPANLTKVPPGMDMSKLCFRLENIAKLKKLYCNQELIKKDNQSRSDSFEGPYEVDMPSFSRHILDLNRQKPLAKYYNIEILRYTLKQEDLQSTSSPLQMISHWQCDPNTTKLRIDLKYSDLYSSSGLTISDIKDLKFSLKVDGGVTSFQSKPQGHWDTNTSELSWRFSDLMQAVDPITCIGSLLARFDLSSGPTKPSLVNVHFAIPSRSLSGLQFKLVAPGYRVSLFKSEVRAGRFVCEPLVAA